MLCSKEVQTLYLVMLINEKLTFHSSYVDRALEHCK